MLDLIKNKKLFDGIKIRPCLLDVLLVFTLDGCNKAQSNKNSCNIFKY